MVGHGQQARGALKFTYRRYCGTFWASGWSRMGMGFGDPGECWEAATRKLIVSEWEHPRTLEAACCGTLRAGQQLPQEFALWVLLLGNCLRW